MRGVVDAVLKSLRPQSRSIVPTANISFRDLHVLICATFSFEHSDGHIVVQLEEPILKLREVVWSHIAAVVFT